LRYAGPLGGLGGGAVIISSPQVDALRQALLARGYEVASANGSSLTLRGAAAAEVGAIAAEMGIALSGLSSTDSSLESAFLQLTDSLAVTA